MSEVNPSPVPEGQYSSRRAASRAQRETLAAAYHYLLEHEELLSDLAEGQWAPSGQVELAAALRQLADSLDHAHTRLAHIDDVGRLPLTEGAQPSLRDHVRALEATVYGAPVEDAPSEEQADAARRAGSGTILLSTGEASTFVPELVFGRISELERRLETLEQGLHETSGPTRGRQDA